ncbi:MAG TPA: GDSL-type esterase/lipase family protein [Puia sp.]|nr:GDSL-type esterase/lipase family protein [Puia sp.]
METYKKARSDTSDRAFLYVYIRTTPVHLFQVKTIALIIGICFLAGALASGFACRKDSSRLAAAMLPPVDTLPDVPADTTSDTTTHTYLALGDSYTIGQSVLPSDRYPVQTAALLQQDHLTCAAPEIIATTGWTTTDLLNALAAGPPDLTRITPAQPYSVVTLLVGVNNQYQGRPQSEYGDQFAQLLRQSIRLTGNRASHVIVLSIPDYSVTPFAHGHNTDLIAAQIDSFNAINAKLSMDYQVHYLDITGESRKAAVDVSLIASDGLHFSGKEYAIWAQKLEPMIKEIWK